MANEVKATAPSGLAMYFQLVSSAGTFWDTALVVFEAYNAAHVTDYANALTEQGASGIYLGTMPSVAADEYYLFARQQVSGAPAQSDPIIGEGTLMWNGTGAVGVGNVDGLTIEQSQRVIMAAAAGVLSGAPNGPILIKNPAGNKTRVNATVDGSGNRTAVTVDGT